MRILIIIFLLSLTGCYSQVTEFDESYNPSVMYRDLDTILKQEFTKEAYDKIKDIPLVIRSNGDGRGLAAGTNFWSKALSFFMGCGIDRKVILTKDSTTAQSIIHEYVHQLHDMDIDGEFECINEEEFLREYRLASNPSTIYGRRFMRLVGNAERLSNSFITNTFGISYSSERIAYIADQLYYCYPPKIPVPLARVYRHIFRRFSDLPP